MKRRPKIDIRYLAGLFDGEGCASLSKSAKQFHPRLIIAMCDELIVRDLARRYGGWVQVSRRGTPKHKPLYRWTVTGRNLLRLAPRLLPYMRVKKKQVELVYKAQKLIATGKPPRPRPGWKTKRLYAYKSQLHGLNRRGVK